MNMAGVSLTISTKSVMAEVDSRRPRAHDQRELRTGGLDVAPRRSRRSRTGRPRALLDAGRLIDGVVQALCTVATGQGARDLLGHDLAQRPAEHGEVLEENKPFQRLDGAVARLTRRRRRGCAACHALPKAVA